MQLVIASSHSHDAACVHAWLCQLADSHATDTGEAELDEATAGVLKLPDSSREAGVGGVTWASRPDGGLDLVRLATQLWAPC